MSQEVRNIEIMQSLIDKFEYKRYLEIGLREGVVFFNLKIQERVGIEPEIKYPLAQNSTVFRERHRMTGKPIPEAIIREMTSDEFFEIYGEHCSKFDIIYVDGMHTGEQAYKDITNSLKALKTNGLILVDDTNPPTEKMADPKGCVAGQEWCGSVWKAIVRLRCEREDIEIATIDKPLGLTLIRHGQQKLLLPADIEMDYMEFYRRKNEILNLKPMEYRA